jgi:hypothetical protein
VKEGTLTTLYGPASAHELVVMWNQMAMVLEDPDAIVIYIDTEFRGLHGGQHAPDLDMERVVVVECHEALDIANKIYQTCEMVDAGAPVRAVFIGSISGVRYTAENGRVTGPEHLLRVAKHFLVPRGIDLTVFAHVRAEMDPELAKTKKYKVVPEALRRISEYLAYVENGVIVSYETGDKGLN